MENCNQIIRIWYILYFRWRKKL